MTAFLAITFGGSWIDIHSKKVVPLRTTVLTLLYSVVEVGRGDFGQGVECINSLKIIREHWLSTMWFDSLHQARPTYEVCEAAALRGKQGAY